MSLPTGPTIGKLGINSLGSTHWPGQGWGPCPVLFNCRRGGEGVGKGWGLAWGMSVGVGLPSLGNNNWDQSTSHPPGSSGMGHHTWGQGCLASSQQGTPPPGTGWQKNNNNNKNNTLESHPPHKEPCPNCQGSPISLLGICPVLVG